MQSVCQAVLVNRRADSEPRELRMSPTLQDQQVSPCHRQSWLCTQMAASVQVTWTNNRSRMLSVKSHVLRGYDIRLHSMFRQAPDHIWHALVAYIRGADMAARQVIQAYVRHHQHLIQPHAQQPRQVYMPPARGHYFDLEAIFHALNHRYFAGRIHARITWSRRPPQRPRTSIRFGSYHASTRLIRVHCLLDQAFVPRYVVESIVFHEMLHQLIPRQRINGRWCIHPPEFRQHERRFPLYQQAEQWQRQHLIRLLHG